MSTPEQRDEDGATAEHTPEHFEEGEEAAPPGVRAMAILRWLLVLGMAGLAALASLHVYGDRGHAEGRGDTQYYCPMHPAVVQDHPGECPICGMTLVARKLEPATLQTQAAGDHAGHRHEPSDPYFCPMHPQETGLDASARCPVCGMKLERRPPDPAVDAGARAAAQPRGAPRPGREQAPPASVAPAAAAPAAPPGLRTVEIPAAHLQLIGMRTAVVRRAALPTELAAPGYVVPTESGLAVIQPRFSGWIEELHVAETGQLVQRGQLLARIYSPELLGAQQELLNARKWASAGGEAGALAESARARLSLLGMGNAEIEQVERSGAPHRAVELRSPVRGHVTQKSALAGLYIQPGTRLFDIVDLSRVWVMVELFERDAGRVALGQRATLQLTAYPGESFSGKVELVYPTLDPATRTQRARVAFQNPALKLRPGMFGSVRIQQAQLSALVVPSEAVVDTGEQQYVFVRESAGRFSPRGVLLGERSEGLVQVLAGLSEGETVVTTGNFLLDSESRLRAAIAGGASAGSP